MARVFINIIKNAIDSMPEGGTLHVQSTQINGNMKISFTDTGTGIPKETLAKLFSPLITTKAQGMGFGLAICKRMVEAHQGRITVQSVEGKGTTITITIPTEPKPKDEKEETWVNVPEPLLSTTET